MNKTLPPGRELDALIAEKVFGQKVLRNKEGKVANPGDIEWWNSGDEDPLEPYSTDIAAAWSVVERLKGIMFFIGIEILYNPNDRWMCRISGDGVKTVNALTFSKSAPHAICLAALKAVGGE